MGDSITVRFPSGTVIDEYTAEHAIRQHQRIESCREDNKRLRDSLRRLRDIVSDLERRIGAKCVNGKLSCQERDCWRRVRDELSDDLHPAPNSEKVDGPIGK